MRSIGNIERFLVVGIVAVIGVILAVAIHGAKGANASYEREALAKAEKDAGGKSARPADGTKTPVRKNDALKRDESASGVRPAADGGRAKEPNGGAPPKPVAPAADPKVDPKKDIATPGADERGSLDQPYQVSPEILAALERQRRAREGSPPEGPAGPVGAGDEPPLPIDAPIDASEDGSKAGSPPPTPGPVEPAVAPVPPPTKVEEYRYEVAKGDSLERIARALYGDGALWKEILAANPELSDASRIRAGQKLKLPKAPTVAGAAASLQVAAVDGVPAPAPRTEPVTKPESASLVNADVQAHKRLTALDEYEVQRGDTLMSIAATHYGTKSAWRVILAANAERVSDKDHIKVGTKLRLPAQ